MKEPIHMEGFTKEGKFENYRLLAKGGYPLSFVLTQTTTMVYAGVWKELGFLDPSKVESNIPKGFGIGVIKTTKV